MESSFIIARVGLYHLQIGRRGIWMKKSYLHEVLAAGFFKLYKFFGYYHQ